MPVCGGLRIGVESIEPKMPPLVMVKVPPCELGERELVGARLVAELGDLLLDLRHRQRVRVAQHRHHQAAAAGTATPMS